MSKNWRLELNFGCFEKNNSDNFKLFMCVISKCLLTILIMHFFIVRKKSAERILKCSLTFIHFMRFRTWKISEKKDNTYRKSNMQTYIFSSRWFKTCWEAFIDKSKERRKGKRREEKGRQIETWKLLLHLWMRFQICTWERLQLYKFYGTQYTHVTSLELTWIKSSTVEQMTSGSQQQQQHCRQQFPNSPVIQNGSRHIQTDPDTTM